MANNYIAIGSGNNRHAATLLGSVNNLAAVKDVLEMLKHDMDNMVDGTDYSVLEAAFGVPGGKGQTVYNLVAGTVAALQGSSDLTNLLGYLAATR